MALIEYTALRALVHAAGSLQLINIETQSTDRSRAVAKNVVRASAGETETLYHRADTRWQIAFYPVRGNELDVLREFLRSTAGAERFRIWLYGNESAPLALRRQDQGHARTPFLRVGREDGDWWKAAPITALEVP